MRLVPALQRHPVVAACGLVGAAGLTLLGITVSARLAALLAVLLVAVLGFLGAAARALRRASRQVDDILREELGGEEDSDTD